MLKPKLKPIIQAVAGLGFFAWLLFMTLTIRHAEQMAAVSCGYAASIAWGDPQGFQFERGPCGTGKNMLIVWPKPFKSPVSDEEAARQIAHERDRDFHGYRLEKPVMGLQPTDKEIDDWYGRPHYGTGYNPKRP